MANPSDASNDAPNDANVQIDPRTGEELQHTTIQDLKNGVDFDEEDEITQPSTKSIQSKGGQKQERTGRNPEENGRIP